MQLVLPSVTVDGDPAADRATAEERLSTEVGTLMRVMHQLKTSAAGRDGTAAVGHDRSAMMLLFPLTTGPLRPGALAELSHADPSTVSRQVAELVARGLVRREPDPSDGRASLLAITDAGREVCDRVRTVRRELLASAVAGWPDAELSALAGLLGRFNAALGAAYRPPAQRPVADSRTGPPGPDPDRAGGPDRRDQDPA